jgi:D-inositol-3-phosphate glycosyltransferase
MLIQCHGAKIVKAHSSLIRVAVLTGGADQPYAFGLSRALIKNGAGLELIGNDELDSPELRDSPKLTFFNLRGDQATNSSLGRKIARVLTYYLKLIRYAATARPKIFHILWNNKFEWFDRTLLTLYYKLLGKRVVLTAHNINARRRDAADSLMNRLTLTAQYRLADHIFVHTQSMKSELVDQFSVNPNQVSVIPFGINNAVPHTDLTMSQAKQKLGLTSQDKTLLFFGNIAPYKGLEYLADAFIQLLAEDKSFRLIIAGRPKNCEKYWNGICRKLKRAEDSGRVMIHSNFIPDDQIENYFKAADVFVLPYRYIYQSGVLFLGQSFGLPAIASNVGSLKDDVIDGKTGFLFRPDDVADIARAIRRYFASDLFLSLDAHRAKIIDHAARHHSWEEVGQKSMQVYAQLLDGNTHRTPSTSFDAKTSP